MKKYIGIVIHPHKKQVVKPLLEIDQWISQRKPAADFHLFTDHSRFVRDQYKHIKFSSMEEIIEKADMVLTLGGDGSILRIIHTIGTRGIPIMGVNLGGLGFLADTAPDMIIDHLEAFLSDNYIIEGRTLMKARCLEDNHDFYALNDIVFDKAGFSRVIEIKVDINGQLLNSYISDALILSTPTGSTGYSMSAGGPIVIPLTEVFVLNPICPHSLSNRPVIVPDKSLISVQVFTEYHEINVFCDGQVEGSYASGVRFEITKADFKANFIKLKDSSFYNTMRMKFHWGEDFRDKQRWSYDNNSPRKRIDS
jgi:NAD+ kinase